MTDRHKLFTEAAKLFDAAMAAKRPIYWAQDIRAQQDWWSFVEQNRLNKHPWYCAGSAELETLIFTMVQVERYWTHPEEEKLQIDVLDEAFLDSRLQLHFKIPNEGGEVTRQDFLTYVQAPLDERVSAVLKTIERYSSLSKAEGEVLDMLCDELSVAKIAEARFVAIGTVRTQVQAILRKLGVNSQAQAVALAYREGLVNA